MRTRVLMDTFVLVTSILSIASCGGARAIATDDGRFSLEISKGVFYISETIEIEITVIGSGIYFHGPCDWWFEKKTDSDWEPVGDCPDTNFGDEPFPQQPGDGLSVSLPMSATRNEATYNYVLTAGTYRYAISYGTESGTSVSYSPQFEVVDD